MSHDKRSRQTLNKRCNSRVISRVLTAAAITTFLAPGGCDRDSNEIHSYRAPKPPEKVAAGAGAGGPMGGLGVSAGPGGAAGAPSDMQGQIPTPPGRGDVVWELPKGWTQAPGNQPMRIATFKVALTDLAGGAGSPSGVEAVPQIEVTLTAFPGDVGGLLANVNRWRGQLGLAEVTEAELPKLVSVVKGANGDFVVVNLRGEGEGSAGLLAAIVQPGDGQSWFVKATGAPTQLEALRPSLEKFAGSFHIHAGSATPASNTAPVAAAPSGVPSGSMPPNHPPIPGTGAGGASDPMSAPGAPQVAPSQASGDVAARLSSWTPPANWTRDAQASGIVAGAFNATNDKGGARVTATSLMGDGGGALSNINRWREQMGLEPVASLEAQATTKLGSGANPATMVDLADAGGARRMLAAIVTTPARGSTPPQSWFFKLTGAPTAVDAEKASFEKLVRVVGLGASE